MCPGVIMIDLDGNSIILKPSLFRNVCKECGETAHFEKIKREFICNSCRFYGKDFRKLANEIKKDAVCKICKDNKNLAIHHKDGNKKNNSKRNLIVLCRQCHLSQHEHNFKKPIEIRWGLFGKRLIYKKVVEKLSIKKDARWGHIFIKKTNNNYFYLV